MVGIRSASRDETLQLEEGITARVIPGRKIPFFQSPDQICIEHRLETATSGVPLEPKKLVDIDHRQYGRIGSLHTGGPWEGKLKVDTNVDNIYGFIIMINYHEAKIEEVKTPSPLCYID